MHRRAILLLPLTAALLACAEAPTQRLLTGASPIRSVCIFAWGNDDPAVAAPAHEALSTTLARNGLAVAQVVTLQQPFADLKALEQAWIAAPSADPASHALVLTRQYQQTGYVRYEAVLWDATERKLVWKGTLASAASFGAVGHAVKPDDSNKRAERLAADVLRGLDRDGIFPLNGKAPRDSRGHEISPTLIPIQLL